MKICFICSNLWPYTYGGSERRYYEIAKELVRVGQEVVYITYDWGPSELRVEPVGPAPVLYDREGKRKISVNTFFGLKAAKKARDLSCDVIDATVPYSEVFFLPSERTLLTLHEFWGAKWRDYYGPLSGRIFEALERKLVKKPKGVIVPSYHVAQKVRIVRGDVLILPFGLRFEEYLPYRRNNKVFDVVYVGRLYPYKGVLKLLEALAAVKKPLRVAIIGQGPLIPVVKEKVSRMAHDIRVYGGVKEEIKKNILGRAKIYVNTSASEGFSISTLEAVVLGAYPIVYSAHGYNAAVELIRTLRFGKVIGSFEELPRLLEELIDAKIQALKVENLEKYDIRRVVQKYLNIIKQVF